MEKLILYLISYITAIYAVVLFVKKNRHQSDIILGIWLIFVALTYGTVNLPGLIYPTLGLTHGVFLYLYTKYVIINTPFSIKELLHFIPVISYFFIFSLFPEFRINNIMPITVLYLIYLFIYFGMSVSLLIRYRKNKYNVAAEDYSPNIPWLALVMGFTIYSYLPKFYSLLISSSPEEGKSTILMIANILFLILLNVIGVKAIRLNLSFIEKKDNFKQNNPKPQYSTYALKDSEADALEKRLRELMDNEKPYLNSDLNLKNLADILNISTHYLSQLLNARFNQNFYDFINSYRLEAVKKELTNPKKLSLSITAIAYDCGFNSQSTFNRVFKQKVGMLPSEYRKQLTLSTTAK